MNLFREPANAAPMAWFTGTKDNSGRTPQLTEAPRAIHNPMHFTYAEKGPTVPQQLVGQELINTYGRKFLEARSQYATPSLPFIRRLQANANPMLIQRLVPGNLPGQTEQEKIDNATARVALCLEIETIENKKIYKRQTRTPVAGESAEDREKAEANFLGDLMLALNKDEQTDASGLPTDIRTGGNGLAVEYRIVDDQRTVPVGFKARWFYQHVSSLGTLKRQPSENKMVYPILEFEATWFGAYGNNLGFSLYAPTAGGAGGVSEKTIRDQLSALYRIEFFERTNSFSTPTTIPNNYGDSFTTFSFKEGAYDKQAGNSDLFIDTMLLDQYRNLEPVAGRAPVYGPFNGLYVYHDSIKEVVEMIYEQEKLHNKRLQAMVRDPHTQGLKSKEEAAHLINFISGFDHDGIEYITYEVDWSTTPFDGTKGYFFPSRSNRIFAMGGNDGDMSDEQFDKDVRIVFENMGTSKEAYKIEDMAQYPVRSIYDVGYTMDTKAAIFRILGLRPDVNLTMSPHDVITKFSTVAEKRVARSLKSKLAFLKQLSLLADNYPESTIFGTSVMRCVFPTNIGKLMGSDWMKEVPSTIEIQEMRSRYMGSPEGRFRTGKHYDESPNNVVSLLKELDDLAVFGSLREQMWAEGGVWFQNKRRNVPFCPAVQTAYKDDTSVLNSDINMQIICEINYICFEVWTELTGSTRYTDEQFIARSDSLITERCRDRFDGRVTVTPRTTLTKQDKDRGWSWTCYVDAELPNMRTVARNTVVAHRIGERS